MYATTREPPGVESGALVACGSAGRGRESLDRSSRGWSSSGLLAVAETKGFARRAGRAPVTISPTPDGVGVKGGGLMGESPSVPLGVAAVRRFLGRGVDGRSGTAKGSSGTAIMEPLASSLVALDGWEGFVDLRFRDAGPDGVAMVGGFSVFADFVGFLAAAMSGVGGALLLATRVERRRDIVTCLCWSGAIWSSRSA